MRYAALTLILWLSGLQASLAQATNPAPPISETGPSGSSSAPATAAATDFNWVWASVLIALAVLALWMFARRRQSGPPR
ncbi:hypothetical protein MPPM_3145 [Methylorubrum populi]|uniref:LPXTG cell wall anchor domain-containing protein n=1 Tax=Methylorubrum populi TaxID=223967 RepID=A0A160PJ41_9HYPH|nr:hypothetical protein MPPM_3145 [Methylorubrum populi]